MADGRWQFFRIIDNTALDNIEGTSAAQKFLHDGHLYIRHARGVYSSLGQMVDGK